MEDMPVSPVLEPDIGYAEHGLCGAYWEKPTSSCGLMMMHDDDYDYLCGTKV